MNNHFSDIGELIPKDAMKNVKSFRVSYVGKYTSPNYSYFHKLFEISPCIDEEGNYGSKPFPFVATYGSEEELYAQLRDAGFKVHADYLGTCGGKKLLYRDVKNLPYF